MKLVTFEAGGKVSWGAVHKDGVVDLGRRLGTRFPTLRDAIPQQSVIEDTLRGQDPDWPLEAIRYLPPIPNPEKIICVGVNYANRNEEYRDGSELPKYPSLFMRTPGSLVGHGQPIVRPRESVQYDYEGEIVLVIGTPGRRIAESDAIKHVFGLSCMNEGSVRDWLRHGKFNVTQGKNFEASGSFGPWIVTADEVGNLDDVAVATKVNGELRQKDTVRSLIFSFTYLLHYISTFTTLKPGDIIATGTPTGAGARFDPPKWLKAGDAVEVSVSGVGTLKNTVIEG